LWQDIWARMALVASQTHRIQLGTAVLIPSLRHVVTQAAAIATIADIAPGRLAVGLATGLTGRAALGQPKRLPSAVVKRYVQQLRGLLHGEQVSLGVRCQAHRIGLLCDDGSPFPSQGLQGIIRGEMLSIVSHPFQEGVSMDFYAVLDQVMDLLRQRGRVTYNALKRQFGLADACLQDLKDEIIVAQRVAVDEAGTVLVWTGDGVAPPPPAAAPAAGRVRQPDTVPLTYTPPHLAEKILAARPALEGERKQVTVLFADLKGNTELIRDLDPEAG